MTALKRQLKSFIYAGRGIVRVFQEERNMRVEAAIGALVVLSGLLYRVSARDWALLVLAISFVIFAELANSAAERLADLAKPRLDSYVKEIKDIMAAAVLIACLAAVFIGGLVFWPHIRG